MKKILSLTSAMLALGFPLAAATFTNRFFRLSF